MEEPRARGPAVPNAHGSRCCRCYLVCFNAAALGIFPHVGHARCGTGDRGVPHRLLARSLRTRCCLQMPNMARESALHVHRVRLHFTVLPACAACIKPKQLPSAVTPSIVKLHADQVRIHLRLVNRLACRGVGCIQWSEPSARRVHRTELCMGASIDRGEQLEAVRVVRRQPPRTRRGQLLLSVCKFPVRPKVPARARKSSQVKSSQVKSSRETQSTCESMHQELSDHGRVSRAASPTPNQSGGGWSQSVSGAQRRAAACSAPHRQLRKVFRCVASCVRHALAVRLLPAAFLLDGDAVRLVDFFAQFAR